MSDIVFRRIHGRIVPIKKKKDSMKSEPGKGAAKIATGSVTGIIGAKLASKDLKKSFSFFRSSSQLRGAAQLSERGSKTYSKLIKKAAKKKLLGIKARNLSRSKFGLALGISTAVISSGVADFFSKESDLRDEVSGAVGTAAGVAIVSASARKFGIRARGLGELFAGFSIKGRSLSKRKIQDIAKTKFDPSRTRKSRQLDFGF